MGLYYREQTLFSEGIQITSQTLSKQRSFIGPFVPICTASIRTSLCDQSRSRIGAAAFNATLTAPTGYIKGWAFTWI